jgi:tetratricopeptide (TPR) repeat protein
LPTDVNIQTLIADLEGGVAAGVRHLYGTRSHARLEIALDTHRDDAPVIVIDAAEHLLDDDRRIRDTELDLAIESIASRRRSRVKVVLVTPVPVAANAEVTWPDTARRLDMSGLEPRFLVDYLRALDAHGRDPRLPPEDDVLLRMHERLAGNPRLAELFHALVARDTAPLDKLAGWLTSLRPSEVRQRVVHRLAGRLPVDERLVLEALAAFGIPVESTALAAVVRPELSPDRCAEAADILVASRIVRQRRDGRLQIPAVDIDPILNRIDDGDRYAEPGEHPTSLDLLHRAANEIYHHQKDYADVHTVGDLDMHFAELDRILRARMFGPAHELIEQIDEEVLQLWGSSALLRRQREAVRHHLGDDDEAAMRNLAALGSIYSSVGETPAADRAFEEALAIARRDNDRGAIRGVYLNMGARYWEHDEITAAREYFTRALALALDDDDDADRALALEGLAGCDQQGGAYTEAFVEAEEAFAMAQDSDSERVVDLALKLARWRTECGDFALAKQRLADADFATDGTDGSRRAEYLNGRADLLLHQGRHPDAVREALRAVDEAEEGCDPEALLQALTTLALAYLYQDEVDEAARQITRAMRYRPSDDHLDTLALRALVASRLGQHATAADFFDRLAHEAKQRIDSYDADSWAWDFLGLTRCFAVARGRPDEVEPAQAAFRRAVADPAMPTHGRNCRIAFLVGQLAAAADRPADLLPVLDDLAISRPCPGGRPSGPRR